MGSLSRRKGANAEREVVNMAREHGLTASRTWETAQCPDPTVRACDVKIEGQPFQCKFKASGFTPLYEGLEGVAGLFVRQNGGQWLVVLDAQDFLSYLKVAVDRGRLVPSQHAIGAQ